MKTDNFLILDTNIWHTTRLLRTSLGAAILYALNQTRTKLALPEVIEKEIEKHAYNQGIKAIEDIHKSYRLLEQLMGSRDNYKVPTVDDLIKRVESRLLEIDSLIHRVDFTLEHAKDALTRVQAETPPNGHKNQQFKDSAIWEAVLELAKNSNVDFVTEDKAFFEELNPKNGLARNLANDCQKVGGEIRVFHGASAYLDAIKTTVPNLDKENVAKKINDVIYPDLSQRASQDNFKLGNIITNDIKVFLTEKNNIVAIEFRLSYSANEVFIADYGISSEPSLVVEGGCSYNIRNSEVSDIQYNHIHMMSKESSIIPPYSTSFARLESINRLREIPYRLKELSQFDN